MTSLAPAKFGCNRFDAQKLDASDLMPHIRWPQLDAWEIRCLGLLDAYLRLDAWEIRCLGDKMPRIQLDAQMSFFFLQLDAQ